MKYSDDYLPHTEELTPTQLQEGRARAVEFLRQALPDVSLDPGTPAGDSLVTPLGLVFAGNDEAHRRLLSDLNLANVAAGTIYSCDLVRAILGNYGVYDNDHTSGYGVVRLVFSTNTAVDIPVHTLFRFGTSDFRPRGAGSVVPIVQAGSGGSDDSYELSQTSISTWAVDIPLVGQTESGIRAGATCELSPLPAGLIGATAVVDFADGVPAAGLSDLARFARKTAWAYNAGSRGGTATAIWRNWPESRMVSPVITGDTEMTRAPADGPLIIQPPAVDIYFRSQYDMRPETQVIRLSYCECAENGVAVKRFRGRVGLLGRPSKIVSLEWAGTGVTSRLSGYTLFTLLPGNSTDDVGTAAEEFYVSAIPVMDGTSGLPLIPILQDDDGQYAMFRVTYLYDPALGMVTRALTSDEHRPVGLSVKVKAGPLVDITALGVTFARAPGVKVLTSAAAAAISSDASASGYPDVFRQTAIYERTKQAGAGSVRSISCHAVVRASPASRAFTYAMDDPGDSDALGDWWAGSVALNFLVVNDIADLVLDTVVQDAHSGGFMEHWAATERTVRMYLPVSAITFTEQ